MTSGILKPIISGHLIINTTEMHSAGEPLRIIDPRKNVRASGDGPGSTGYGYPVVIPGRTLLEKRRYVRDQHDALRCFLMWEPRGHRDMYGALLVDPDRDVSGTATPGGYSGKEDRDAVVADLAVLFMHNEGYSTMCGHAVIALGRYAVDSGLVPSERVSDPETEVRIQCPCGVVKAYVETVGGFTTGRVRFHSVPAFAFSLGTAFRLSLLRGNQADALDYSACRESRTPAS